MLQRMSKPHEQQTFRTIVTALRRIDTNLDTQHGRMGQLQRQLDAEAERLAFLDAQVEVSRARLMALLPAPQHAA